MNYKEFRQKEKSFYEKIGVKCIKKLVLKLPLPKFGAREENNYYLKKGNGIADLQDQKKFFYFNGVIHGVTLLWQCFFASVSPVFLLITSVIQVYLIMLQRYNYIRIEEVIEKGESLEKKKIKNLKIYILEKEAQLKMHHVRLYGYELWKEVTISESLEDILNQASYLELMYYKRLFCHLEKENQQGVWHSDEYDIPSLDNSISNKTFVLTYDYSSIKDKKQSS